MVKKAETVEEFIKRKNELFEENKVIEVKDIGRKGKHFSFEKHGLFYPKLI